MSLLDKTFDPNQRRHPRGSREGGRWAPQGAAASAAASEAPEGDIPRYLRMISEMTGGGRPTIEGFILEHGRPYKTDAKTFIGGERHQCYKNTTLAVLSDPSLTYVEGYVSVHGVPIHHAWAVDRDGIVRDFTIPDGKGIQGYFGVPIKTDFALAAQMKRGKYGILVRENYERAMAIDPTKDVKKAFDPNQPRHPRGSPQGGQWAPQGGSPLEVEIEGEVVERASPREVAEAVARDLGYDPSRIDILDSASAPDFQVDGGFFKAAGLAHLDTGRISLYPGAAPPEELPGIVAHEVMHHKFHAYLTALRAEFDELRRDPGPAPDPLGRYYWQRRGGIDAIMKPDGTMRDDFVDIYPLVHRQAMREREWREFQQDDGVSHYSRRWWDAAVKGTAGVGQAYHETLAEMARIHYETGRLAGTPRWNAFYRDVVNNYRRAA